MFLGKFCEPFFFITHGGKLVGNVYSPQYFRLPIATTGLEILIDCDFKIEASKLKFLERLKEIIENYEPVVEREGGERWKEEESDELEILFVDDFPRNMSNHISCQFRV